MMKILTIIFAAIGSLIASVFVYAEATEFHSTPVSPPATASPAVSQPAFQAIQWVSKDSTDPVTIENGTGTPIVIEITVSNTIGPKATGINIKNCGETKHLDVGSSTICSSSDPANPVSFSSDSGTDPASGTYVIKQK